MKRRQDHGNTGEPHAAGSGAARVASRARTLAKIGIGVAALIASMLMTTAYHLGYSDFRSAKIARPVAGDVVWSVPTLVTLNPIGAPIPHAGMHIAAVAAVLHSPQTETFFLPHE